MSPWCRSAAWVSGHTAIVTDTILPQIQPEGNTEVWLPHLAGGHKAVLALGPSAVPAARGSPFPPGAEEKAGEEPAG